MLGHGPSWPGDPDLAWSMFAQARSARVSSFLPCSGRDLNGHGLSPGSCKYWPKPGRALEMTGPIGSWPWLGWFWSILVIAGLPPTMTLLSAQCSYLTFLRSGLSLTLVLAGLAMALSYR